MNSHFRLGALISHDNDELRCQTSVKMLHYFANNSDTAKNWIIKFWWKWNL